MPSVAGRIRPGIKVLTKSAVEKRPDARSIYAAGLARGDTFDAIEAELKKRCGFDKSPLTPKNVPYFRVARADFAIPEVADAILSRYGEDRGDGRQLYRLPVILPFDEALDNLPHQLAAFSASTKRYWSEYEPDGTRRCMKYAPAAANPMNRRALRAFGGRKPILNTEWQPQGLCDPEACPVYQARECALKGKLQFWIPGIAGSSLFEIPTGSFYSLSQMLSTMKMVLAACGGRIAGMHQGQPLFYVTKVTQEVSRLDEHGNPTRQLQHIIHLEAALEMGSLTDRSPRLVLEAKPEPAEEPDTDPTPADSPPAAKRELPPEVIEARRRLFSRVLALQLNVEAFTTRCVTEWGEEWGTSMAALTAALDVLPANGTDEEVSEYQRWLRSPF